MAVELIKPEDEGDDQDVVELVLVEGGDDDGEDEGAPVPGRLRAFWDQCLADADADRTDAPRAFAVPSILQYAVPIDDTKDGTWAGLRGGLVNVPVRVWAGTVIIVRWVRTKPWKRKAKVAPKAPAKAPAKAKKGKAKAAAKPEVEAAAADQAPAAAPAAKAKGEGRGGNIVAVFIFGGMGVTALGGYVDVIVNVAIYGAGVFVAAAWIVGGVAQIQAEVAVEPEAPEDDEPAEVADADDDLGETDDQTPVDDGGEGSGEPYDDSPEAARIRVYQWVRKAIGTNKGVHLRELLLDVQSQPGGEGVTMPQLKAHLAAHGIPWRESQKAPASDHGGAKRNRPGINVDDLPQGYAPIETPGSNLIRLLPTYQGPDQG